MASRKRKPTRTTKPPPKTRRSSTTSKSDFGDEEAVLGEMAQALDGARDEMVINEDRGLSGFGAGTAYRVEWGTQEYIVVESHDQMQELALEVVKQDLEQEPEIFNKDFIEQHIDKDKLRRELESDVLNMRIDDLTEMDPDDFWKEYERAGFDAPEENEDGERREPEQSEIEELAEDQTKEELRDPMEYLEGIYGDEAAAKGIEIAGIDIDAAAQEAVSADGAEHFLARYDGDSHETRSGFVYWRVN